MRALALLILVAGCADKSTNGTGGVVPTSGTVTTGIGTGQTSTGTSSSPLTIVPCTNPIRPELADCVADVVSSFQGEPPGHHAHEEYNGCGLLEHDDLMEDDGTLSTRTTWVYTAEGVQRGLLIDPAPLDGIYEYEQIYTVDAQDRLIRIESAGGGIPECTWEFFHDDADELADRGTDSCLDESYAWLYDASTPFVLVHAETDQGQDGSVEVVEDYAWDPATATTTYTRNGPGNPAGGLFLYDAELRLVRAEYHRQNGAIQYALDYTYDAEGRLATITTGVPGPVTSVFTYTWSCPP